MKSKIEEKIKNAREATNEMFAAFEELNESLKEKEPEKWLPKDGEYCAHTDEVGDTLICIYKNKERGVLNYYVGCKTWLSYRLDFYDWCITEWIDRPATPEEIALLDSKLAEQGKRFDKEKLELVDIQKFQVGDWFIPHKPKVDVFPNWTIGMDRYNNIPCRVSRVTDTGCLMFNLWNFHPDWCEKITAPKHKEPIIGEMAIFWDSDKDVALIGILEKIIVGDYGFCSNSGEDFANAILFESPEQYKDFLKS